MEDEHGNIVENEVKALNDATSFMLSAFTNNKIKSEIAKAEEFQISRFPFVEQQELLLKEAFRELLELEAEDAHILNEAKTEPLDTGMTQLITQISQTNGKKIGLDEEISALKSRISHNEQLKQQLEQKRTSFAKQNLTAIPKANASFQMYAQISRLKWDYTAPENFVKGFVVQPQNRDVTHYKIDKDSQSQCFITNFLWELIGSDSDF